MTAQALVLILSLNAARAAEAPPPAPQQVDTAVTRIEVVKSQHELRLLAGEAVVARYQVAIGPGGPGFKRQEGDQVTPVGRYHITRRSPSRFRVFLGLDYPNADDRARFARLRTTGELPRGAHIGGDVGIHGAPPTAAWKKVHKTVDWTLGCVAVDDEEIEEIAARVKVGTPVDIVD